jgi:carbonic anhydrase
VALDKEPHRSSKIHGMSTDRNFKDPFEDIFRANGEYVLEFKSSALTGQAKKGLAIVTCMDSRIDPLRIVGMSAGDAKILRNAGARVTEDVLRTLLLAVHLLGVNRVLVMPHTDCRMASGTEEEIHQAIWKSAGVDTRAFEMRTVLDQRAAAITDLTRIRSFPLMPKTLEVRGAIYDVQTGRLTQIVEDDLQDRVANEN